MVVLQALVLITKHRSFHVRSHPTTSSNGVRKTDQTTPT